MSWKKIATVAVCALMTTSAWAGPTLDVRNTGLDSSGNWTWELRATPDASLFQTQTQGTGGSLAIELGLQASLGSILSITSNPGTIPNAPTGSAAAPVEYANPGNVIFGWETLTDVDPSPTVTNLKPVGIQIGTAADSNKAFIAVGTTFFKNTDAVPTNGHLIATIKTTGPDSDDATNFVTTSLQVLGSYSGKGVIAQSTGPSTSVLFNNFSGSATRVVRDGDANLDGVTDFLDYQALLDNYNQSPRTWSQSDFNRDGVTDFLDYQVILDNYNQGTSTNSALTIVGTSSGAGAGSSTTIPEPASLALAGLALLAGVVAVRRK